MNHDVDIENTGQVKITIELSGNSPQVHRVLDAVRAALADEDWSDGRSEAAADASWWTAERAAAFVRRLKPPALQALHAIAESAPTVRVSVVQRHLQRAGLALTPGALSSVGFAVRALGSPQPFVRDNYQRVYRMEPAVAAALLPAIEAERSRRRATTRQTGEASSE